MGETTHPHPHLLSPHFLPPPFTPTPFPSPSHYVDSMAWLGKHPHPTPTPFILLPFHWWTFAGWPGQTFTLAVAPCPLAPLPAHHLPPSGHPLSTPPFHFPPHPSLAGLDRDQGHLPHSHCPAFQHLPHPTPHLALGGEGLKTFSPPFPHACPEWADQSQPPCPLATPTFQISSYTGTWWCWDTQVPVLLPPAPPHLSPLVSAFPPTYPANTCLPPPLPVCSPLPYCLPLPPHLFPLPFHTLGPVDR